MNTKTTTQIPFLTRNTMLDDVVSFATNNNYQSPKPSGQEISEFDDAMKQLFILQQRVSLLPGAAPKKSLEDIAVLYFATQAALFNLLYVCPPPEDALGWFDYQQEYNARKQQMENLEQLINWHQQFYQNILTLAPPLPLPFPTGFPLQLENKVSVAGDTSKPVQTSARPDPSGGLPDLKI